MSHRLLWTMACAMVWATPVYAQDKTPEPDPGSDGIAQLIPMSNAQRGAAFDDGDKARAGLAHRVGASVKRACHSMWGERSG